MRRSTRIQALTSKDASAGALGDTASLAGSRGRVSKSTARKRARGQIEAEVIVRDDNNASERNPTTDSKSKRARTNRKAKHVEPASRRSARIFARMNGPIHRLPAELLSEIFLHLRELLDSGWGYPNPTPKLDDTITRVCKSWRRIAHGTPLLWQYIVPQSRELAEYLRRYLPLTGTCSLHVDLCRTMYSSDQSGIEQLRDHSHRMRSLRLIRAGHRQYDGYGPYGNGVCWPGAICFRTTGPHLKT